MPKLVLTKVAWRNLVSAKRSGLSFMTAVSILGIAIGVCSLVVVLSVMAGFAGDLKDGLISSMPHVEVFNKNQAQGISLKKIPLKKICSSIPGATSCAPFTRANTILKLEDQVSGVVLLGIDPKLQDEIWGFQDKIIEGDWRNLNQLIKPSFQIHQNAKDVKEYPSVYLGLGLANQVNATAGDLVTVVSIQNSIDGMLGGSEIARKFVVGGLFHTESQELDSQFAVVSIQNGRKFMVDYDSFLDEQNYVSGVGASVEDPLNVETKTPTFFSKLGLDYVPWVQTNSSILYALMLEKYAMGFVLLLISVVAAFSISGTMIMTVFFRRGRVSLLRAMGMKKTDIVGLYLIQGVGMGVFGVLAGLVAGLLICSLIQNVDVLDFFPNGHLMFKKLPVKFLPFDYIVVCCLALLLAVVASVYPAFVAAQTQPSQGLRYL